MDISVIIPVYNGAKTVRKTIESVRLQTVPVQEIIIIDDGSADNTIPVIKEEFGELIRDKFLIVVEKQNEGPSATRNLGVRLAKFPWIAFLDADDTWHPEKIARQIACMHDIPGTKLCGTLTTLNKNKPDNTITAVSLGNMLVKNYFATSSVLIEQAVFQALNGFDTNQKYSEDYNLWLKVVAYGHKAIIINTCLVVYDNDDRGSRLSKNMKAMFLGERKNFRELKDLKLIGTGRFYFANFISWLKYRIRLLK